MLRDKLTLLSIKVLGQQHSLQKHLLVRLLLVGVIPVLVISVMALWLATSMATTQVTQNLSALKTTKLVAIEAYGDSIVNQVITASADPSLGTNLIELTRSFRSVVKERLAQTGLSERELLTPVAADLTRFYQQNFMSDYRNKNPKAIIHPNKMLDNLSDNAAILQHAYIVKNTEKRLYRDHLYRSKLELSYDYVHNMVHQNFKMVTEKFSYNDIFLIDVNGNVVYLVFKEIDFATNISSASKFYCLTYLSRFTPYWYADL